MTTTERYRRLRKDDPYLPARYAWSAARSATVAEAAGVRSWAQDDRVTIDGREYLLTVEPDPYDSWDGDCFGTVEKRGTDYWGEHPEAVEWPCVPLPGGGPNRSVYYGEDETYYNPGQYWETWTPKGMARGLVRPYLTAMLVAEGVMIRDTSEYVVTLTDADGDIGHSLGGVGLGEGDTWERSYLYDVVTELAAEIEYDRVLREWTVAERLAMRTSHG